MSELKDPITVSELVAAMNYNGTFEGWTKEAILTIVKHYWKPLTAAQMGQMMHLKERELEQARKRTVLVLEMRNKEYGRSMRQT